MGSCQILARDHGPRDWLLLKDMYMYQRLGNLIWATASLIGIALTLGYQPRAADVSDYHQLRMLFPALNVWLVDSDTWRTVRCRKEWNGIRFQPHLLGAPPNSAISGYLQSHRYFANHSTEILRRFRFNATVEAQARRFITKARQQRGYSPKVMTVAVHVRRGDLAHSRTQAVPDDYWRRGIAWLRQSYPDREMLFIVMAGGNVDRREDRQDYAYARQHIPVRLVPTPISHTPATDLAIMAHSDAVVISGGSFGFWGAYLNHKICIAPDCPVSRDYKGYSGTDYYPPWCELLSCTHDADLMQRQEAGGLETARRKYRAAEKNGNRTSSTMRLAGDRHPASAVVV